MLPCCSITLVYHACAYDASNHSELTSKTSTHLAFSALKWFEKVRGGSRGLNHSETVYRYPTHLVTTVKMRFEKVRYSRTTPNSRQRLLRACVTSKHSGLQKTSVSHHFIMQRVIPTLSPLVFMPSLSSSFHNSKNFFIY